MDKSKYIVYVANVFVIFYIINRIIETNNDKSIIILLVFYPILLLINLLLVLIFKILKKKIYKTFVISSLFVLASLIPILIICKSLNLF